MPGRFHVDTGHALDIGRRGDAGVVLVHDRPGEDKALGNFGHDGLAGPATALRIIATDMSITVITLMMMIGMMIGVDKQQRGGDDRADQDHDRHRRHQQHHQRGSLKPPARFRFVALAAQHSGRCHLPGLGGRPAQHDGTRHRSRLRRALRKPLRDS